MCTINVSLVFKLVKLLKMWTSVTYTLFSLHCILPTEIEKLWIKRITQWIFFERLQGCWSMSSNALLVTARLGTLFQFQMVECGKRDV